MDRGRVGEDRESKETDGCPLTISTIFIVLIVLIVLIVSATAISVLAISVYHYRHHRKKSIPPETHMEHVRHSFQHLGRHSHLLIERSTLFNFLINTTSLTPTELSLYNE
jgi:hypothetical protein